jgi:hypothetical protein
MKLVWQNPLPLVKTEPTLERIKSDEFGALYAVTVQESTRQFEVLVGEVA